MGSLYSVGMSNESVQGIASAFGKIASGDITGLTGSGAGNLLVMAANKANLSIGDMLNNSLSASDTNKLFSSVVDYLGSMYNSTKSLVAKQQLAKVFGLSASDLKAASNLSTSQRYTINRTNMNYSDMINNLFTMAGSMYQRTSIGELMSNAKDNFMYTLSASMANNVGTYATMMAANLLQDLVGGIPIPTVYAVGSGVDLKTSVAQMMQAGALSASLLQGVGTMISSGGGGGISGKQILNALGISGGSIMVRGGSNAQSNYIGNSNDSDVYNSTFESAKDQKQEVTADEGETITTEDTRVMYDNVQNIYDLLFRATSDTGALKVITSNV